MIKKIVSITSRFVEVLKGTYFAFKTLFRGMRVKITEEPEKKILIMGNGPSLKKIDIDKFLGTDAEIVCVNFFPVRDERFFKIKPRYLCLLDPVFYERKTGEAKTAKDELLEKLESVDWEMTIICPQGNRLNIKNDNITYAPICTTPFYGEGLEKMRYFLYRNNLVNCGLQNVVLGACYYFVTKKVNTIYLAGIDMSEFKMLNVDEDNEVYVMSHHHYGTEKIKHSDLGIIKKGEFYKLLGLYLRMFEQFYFLEKYARSQGVKVYNLSVESYVDVFEKNKDYLLEEC